MSLYILIHIIYRITKRSDYMTQVLKQEPKFRIEINFIDVYNGLKIGYPLTFKTYYQANNWLRNHGIDSLNTVYFLIRHDEQIIYTGKLKVNGQTAFIFEDWISNKLNNMRKSNVMNNDQYEHAVEILKLKYYYNK
ncbi:MAG: hypothetical protein ACW981_14145 [Candidatus Hodarchaeales archaeon]